MKAKKIAKKPIREAKRKQKIETHIKRCKAQAEKMLVLSKKAERQSENLNMLEVGQA